MGKQVTVLQDYSYVELPTDKGWQPFQAGDTTVLTDAEYAALPAATTRCLGAPTDVAEPARPSDDPNAETVNENDAATGNVDVEVGVNLLTLTGNVTLVFPSDVTVGTRSEVELVLKQDATGSRTLTLPASAKAAGGTDPVLSTAANSVDYLKYVTVDGGATWLLTNSKLALA